MRSVRSMFETSSRHVQGQAILGPGTVDPAPRSLGLNFPEVAFTKSDPRGLLLVEEKHSCVILW